MESGMKCSMSSLWSAQMPKGLELEVCHHPLTMKRVVNLIVATERLKGGRFHSAMSTEFRDEHLLDIMMEGIVEEQVVFERGSAPSVQYSKTGELQCSVADSEKRSLVLVRDSMELHAVMLQGGDEGCKVHLNMSTYLDRQPQAEARTVALGIIGTNLYLSCHKDGDEPSLHLEEVKDKSKLSGITSDSDMVRFLFYKKNTGVNICNLVSVLFSDWYISSAVENNTPLEMCTSSEERHRIFDIHQVTSPVSLPVECRCASESQA